MDDINILTVPASGINVYYSVNSFLSNSRKIEATALVNALSLDLDLGKVPEVETIEDLTKYALSLDPSTIIFTGNGVQTLHLLDEPYLITNEEDRELIKDLQYKWVAYNHGDPRSKDITRVQRVPGTQNLKYLPEQRKAEWLEARFGVTYSLEDLLNMVKDVELPAKAVKKSIQVVGEKRVYLGLSFSLLLRDRLKPDDMRLVKALQRERAKDGQPKEIEVQKDGRELKYASRSEGEKALVARLILKGRTYEDGVALFEKWKLGHYMEQKAYRKNYLRAIWQEQEII